MDEYYSVQEREQTRVALGQPSMVVEETIQVYEDNPLRTKNEYLAVRFRMHARRKDESRRTLEVKVGRFKHDEDERSMVPPDFPLDPPKRFRPREELEWCMRRDVHSVNLFTRPGEVTLVTMKTKCGPIGREEHPYSAKRDFEFIPWKDLNAHRQYLHLDLESAETELDVYVALLLEPNIYRFDKLGIFACVKAWLKKDQLEVAIIMPPFDEVPGTDLVFEVPSVLGPAANRALRQPVPAAAAGRGQPTPQPSANPPPAAPTGRAPAARGQCSRERP